MKFAESHVWGDLTIDDAHRRVTVEDCPTRLTATQYNLLAELGVNTGRVWARKPLNQSMLDQTRLRRLPREVAENPTYLCTWPRVGRRMAKGQPTGAEDYVERQLNGL